MELRFKSSLIYSRACSEPLHCTVFLAMTCIQFMPQGFVLVWVGEEERGGRRKVMA